MESIVSDQIVKRKKGRPRKNVDVQNILIENPIHPVEKKKRGRKKKIVVEEEVKPKKKRGRKAAIKFFSSSIRKKIPLTTILQDNNNYILHIPISDDNINNNLTFDSIDEIHSEMSLITSMLPNIRISNNENIKKTDLDNSQKLQNIKNIINSEYKDTNKDANNDTELCDSEDESDCNSEDDSEDEIEGSDNSIENTNDEGDSSINDNDTENSIDINITNNTIENDIKDLYEKRIENREKQDQLLFEKLDKLHKDDTFLSNLIINDKNDIVITNKKNNDEKANSRKKGYFSLLYDFISNKDWLEKTDVCCWWCCHSFDTVPIGLPVDYKNDKFRVNGIYCSFACMKAENNDKKLYKDSLIKFLYIKLTNDYDKRKYIKPAPPRCALKMFGGELSIEDFRKNSNENKIYKLIEYPMFISRDYIEEVDLAHVKNVNFNVFKDVKVNKEINADSNKIAEAKLRLSEAEKSTITFGNTIDKFIKIS